MQNEKPQDKLEGAGARSDPEVRWASKAQEKIVKRFNELSETRKFLLAGGIGIYTLAFVEYLSVPRAHNGRWAWLLNWAIDVFGAYGAVYLWLALGTFLIVKAFTGKQEGY